MCTGNMFVFENIDINNMHDHIVFSSTSEDEDELDARIGDNNDGSYVKVPKRQRKLFETRVVEEKVHDP